MAGPLSGSSPTEDGVLGVTESGGKSGVFGSNVSTDIASSPGGNGVFGSAATLVNARALTTVRRFRTASGL